MPGKAPLTLTEYRILAASVRGGQIQVKQHRQRTTWRVNGKAATKPVLSLLARGLLAGGEAGASTTPAGVTAMEEAEAGLQKLALPATVVKSATICGRDLGDGLAAVYFADGSFLAIDLAAGTADWREAVGDECTKGGKPFEKMSRVIRDAAVAAFREAFKDFASERVASGETVKQVRQRIAAQYAPKKTEATCEISQ